MTKHTSLLYIGSLLVISLVLLPILNGDMLFMVQSRSFFMQGPEYLADCMHYVGGILIWAGTALTQLFYYPWAGSVVLILLWIAMGLLLRVNCRVSDRWQWLHFAVPVALLVSVVDLGYWIYYLKQPGYFFRETLGFLCVAIFLWRRERFDIWLMLIFAAILYPLLGFYSVLALGLIALRSIINRYWPIAIVSTLAALLVPGLVVRHYDNIRPIDAWTAGFPFIESNQTFSWPLTTPFIVAIILLIVLVVMSEVAAARTIAPSPEASKATRIHPMLRFLPYLLWAVTLCMPILLNRTNHNYHAEMRISRLIDEQRWEQVLDEVDKAPKGPTRQMVVAKHIALIHTNHLHDLLYAFPNIGPNPAVGDSLPVHMAQTSAAQFYLYHGLTNDAIHWCIENGVEYGFTFSDLRYMTLGALVNGESKLALKYLNMLSRSWFYHDFVRRYYPLVIHPEWFGDYPELQVMRELHNDVAEYLRGDDGNVEWRLYRTFSNQIGHYYSPLAQTIAVAYAMMRKEPDLFWEQCIEYVNMHPNEKFPLEFQEAAYLFTQLDGAKYSASHFRFDQSVVTGYKSFRQTLDGYSANPRITLGEVKQAMKKQFGYTYWYFYYFCTNTVAY